MQAYHGDPAVKAKYIARMREHQEADELVCGIDWENGKGNAVGCTVHTDNSTAYETELGMPEWLARLEELLFEGMTNETAQQFPVKLLEAVPIGFSDWDDVYHGFCAHTLRECRFDREKFPDVVVALDIIVDLHEDRSRDGEAWDVALSAALAVASSAFEVTVWTADSITKAAAKSATWSARAATESAAAAAMLTAYYTALSAAQMTETVSESAARAVSESAAKKAARSAAYDSMGDWLVRRLSSA